jgi:hypothetical protein
MRCALWLPRYLHSRFSHKANDASPLAYCQEFFAGGGGGGGGCAVVGAAGEGIVAAGLVFGALGIWVFSTEDPGAAAFGRYESVNVVFAMASVSFFGGRRLTTERACAI